MSTTTTRYSTGAVRHDAKGRGAYALIPPYPLERLAKLFGYGAEQPDIGARNWEKGIPFSRVIEGMFRHLVKLMMREPDKEHDDNLAAIAFWAFALMHYQEMIRRGVLPASLDDMPRYDGTSDGGTKVTTPAGPPVPDGEGPQRVYVAGPLSAPTKLERFINVMVAIRIGHIIESRGHYAHVPHAATCWWGNSFTHERYLEHDRTYLKYWATRFYYIAPSPGADRELAWARELNIPVWECLDDVPMVDHSTWRLRPEGTSNQIWIERLYDNFLGGLSDAAIYTVLNGLGVSRLGRGLRRYSHTDDAPDGRTDIGASSVASADAPAGGSAD